MAATRARRPSAHRWNKTRVTAVAALALLVLAALDASFAGFRSSLGRTGLIDHRREDRTGAVHGLLLMLALLGPVAVAVTLDAATRQGALPNYTDAGLAMLTIYAPYAAVVFLALGSYLALGWRKRYLAAALILGPFTLLRPVIAALGAVLAVTATNDTLVAVFSCLSTAALLAIEPTANKIWHRHATGSALNVRD